jgi:RecB family exonuclease
MSELTVYETPPLKAWSFSRLEVFEKCPYRAELQYVQKLEEDNDPKREEALNRGKRVHKDAELYVQGELDGLTKELKKFEDLFKDLRERYAADPSMFILEEQWAFTRDWQPTEWYADDAWCRMIPDRGEWLDTDKTALKVADYKTGKKDGNEVKHAQQGQLLVVGSFMKFPALQVAEPVFEYLDHGKKSLRKTYTREQAMVFLPAFERRGLAMTEATRFQPKPNRINCAWCPYGPSRGNGKCIYGVEV